MAERPPCTGRAWGKRSASFQMKRLATKTNWTDRPRFHYKLERKLKHANYIQSEGAHMEKQYAIKDGYWLMGFQYEITGSLYSFGQIPRCKVSMLEHLKPAANC